MEPQESLSALKQANLKFDFLLDYLTPKSVRFINHLVLFQILLRNLQWLACAEVFLLSYQFPDFIKQRDVRPMQS